LDRFFLWLKNHPARAATLAGWYQQGCAIFGSIIAIPVVLKLLGKHDAGLWFSFQGFLLMIGLADFGFSMAISRQAAHSLRFDKDKYIARAPDLIETRPGWLGVSDLYASSRLIFWRLTIIAGVGLIVLHEAVLPFTRLMEGRSIQFAFVWYALGLSTLLTFQTRLSQSFLDGIGYMFLGRFIAGNYQLLWNLAAVAALLLAPGLLGMALAVLAASVLQLFAMHFALKKVAGNHIDFSLPASKPLIHRLWKVALPFGFVNSGSYLVGAVQVPLLGSILGPAAVAPYYLAARISQTLGAAVLQLTTSHLPIFTQQCASGDMIGAKRRMEHTFWFGVFAHLAGALFLYFASPKIVDLWVGPGQYVGAFVLLLFSLNFFLGGASVVPAHFVLAAGSNPFPLTTLLHGVLTVIGVLVFCPIIGVAGVPLSSLVAGLCTNYWYVSFKGWQTWRDLARAGNSPLANAKVSNGNPGNES
jgi:O-antigen/teichoic acid export membrane protein